MPSQENNLNKSIMINLTQLIPYKVRLSSDQQQLILERGVIFGTIIIESLKLEIQKKFPVTSEDISFYSKNDSTVLFLEKLNENYYSGICRLILDIISRELPLTLKHRYTKNPLVYITEEMIGFPLVGSLYVGIIDRGTNILQVRALTGCPLNCPFCSVDEGPASKTKIRDYIVDPDFLVNSYNAIANAKKTDKLEAHFDGQCEPMSYPYLVDVIRKIKSNSFTSTVSIQTSGYHITEKLVDKLAAAGLDRINFSLNAMTLRKAKRLSGRGNYPFNTILQLAEYIANSPISLLLAPVWVPGVNDDDIVEIIKFARKINAKESRYPLLGIQNYMTHKEGRNIPGIHTKDFKLFNKQLREFEKKYKIRDLVLKPYMFNCFKSDMIPNPFSLHERISAEIVLPGRIKNEVIAKAKNRLIHVSDVENYTLGSRIKLQIIRNRHNIFFGKQV